MADPWTPGPWTLAYDNDHDGDGHVTMRQVSVESSGATWTHIRVTNEGAKTIAADARLIAAAPEMAELLAKAVRTQADPKYHTPTHWVAESAALLARIRGEA